MMIHRVIRIGGSVGVTLPKRFLEASKIKVGDKIAIEMNSSLKTLFIKPKNLTYRQFLTPDFFRWMKRNHRKWI